jgi:hypothetical protein
MRQLIRAHQTRGENRNQRAVLNSACWLISHRLSEFIRNSQGTRFSIPDLNDVQQLCDLLTCEALIQFPRIDTIWSLVGRTRS